MKRKRNQRWLSIQLRRARDENMLLSFFVNFPAQRTLVCNGMRLEQRGRLQPDWQRALFHKGWGKYQWWGQVVMFTGLKALKKSASFFASVVMD